MVAVLVFADDFDTSSPTIESMLKPIFAFDPGIVVNVVGVGGIILFSCNEVRLMEFFCFRVVLYGVDYYYYYFLQFRWYFHKLSKLFGAVSFDRIKNNNVNESFLTLFLFFFFFFWFKFGRFQKTFSLFAIQITQSEKKKIIIKYAVVSFIFFFSSFWF